MAEKLEWLDQEYLSHYDRNDREAQIDSHIPMQKGFDAPKEVEAAYSITEERTRKMAAICPSVMWLAQIWIQSYMWRSRSWNMP